MSLNASNFDQVFTANVKVVEVFRDSHKNLRVSKWGGDLPLLFKEEVKVRKERSFQVCEVAGRQGKGRKNIPRAGR